MNESVVRRIFKISQQHPYITAQLIKDENEIFQAQNYEEFMSLIFKTAYFLKHECGVSKGQNIGLICDNRSEWVVCDLALQSLKAVNVPRGTETNIEEIAFILKHSECSGCIFEKIDTYIQLTTHKPKITKKLKFVIFLENTSSSKKKFPKHTFFFEDITHRTLNNTQQVEIETHVQETSPNDRVTIIYTSGTTAQPKGVCITQRAFEIQIDEVVPNYIPIKPGNVFLSVLPIWHAYAREMLYIVLGSGATVAYSQPIGSVLLKDINSTKTNYLTSVPRIWEGVHKAIYSKVRSSPLLRRSIFKAATYIAKIHCHFGHLVAGNYPDYQPRNKIKDFLVAIIPYLLLFPLRLLFDALVFKKLRALLGPNFIAGISGGGALAPSIDKFFEAAKIKVLEGYGLTEMAPVISVRKQHAPEVNSVGKIFPSIEYRIIDERGNFCPTGIPGILHLRSPQVMQGYYKNEQATNVVLNKEGWLNTGDLASISGNGCLKILGRSKDTIVLSNGENVEPEHVETIVKESPYISQIMVIGQDKKTIAALIVPDKEILLNYARKNNMSNDITLLCKDKKIRTLFNNELNRFKERLNSYEQVHQFALLPNEFEIGIELTQTLKLKRNAILTKYENIINAL